MLTRLLAPAPHPDLPADLDIYAPLLGEPWQVRNRILDETSGAWRENRRTWQFARTLDGLGIQDVLWGETGTGTTVRVFDGSLGAWRVSWFGPRHRHFDQLVARPTVDGIAQDGQEITGRPIRWNFTGITSTGFTWEGFLSNDGGQSWLLNQRMTASRA